MDFNYLVIDEKNVLVVEYGLDTFSVGTFSFEVVENNEKVNFREIQVENKKIVSSSRIVARKYKTFRSHLGIVKNSLEANKLIITLAKANKR
jgi:hypothetical protein